LQCILGLKDKNRIWLKQGALEILMWNRAGVGRALKCSFGRQLNMFWKSKRVIVSIGKVNLCMI